MTLFGQNIHGKWAIEDAKGTEVFRAAFAGGRLEVHVVGGGRSLEIMQEAERRGLCFEYLKLGDERWFRITAEGLGFLAWKEKQ